MLCSPFRSVFCRARRHGAGWASKQVRTSSTARPLGTTRAVVGVSAVNEGRVARRRGREGRTSVRGEWRRRGRVGPMENGRRRGCACSRPRRGRGWPVEASGKLRGIRGSFGFRGAHDALFASSAQMLEMTAATSFTSCSDMSLLAVMVKITPLARSVGKLSRKAISGLKVQSEVHQRVIRG